MTGMHRATGHPQASPVLAFFARGRRGRAGAAWAVLAALLCACTAPTTTMTAPPAPPLHALPGGFTEHRWPAAHGQTVQVRTQSGQQISGVARAGGLVEVAF